MFDYSILHWAAFITAATLLNVTPGPDMAFILGQTAFRGRRAGFAASFGIWTGAFGHVLMAGLGLSAILASSATAFALVKWLGAGYLIYLGLRALFGGGGYRAAPAGAPPGDWKVFRQGVLVAALNPKVAMFYLAFLPQFVEAGAGPIWAQLALHGTLIIVLSVFVEVPLVLAGAALTGAVRNRPGVGRWLDRGLGALFVALGARLAFIQRG